MLVRSQERVYPFGINTIVLQDKEGYYYYVHRSVYDDAVILYDRYKDDTNRLLKVIGKGEDVSDDIKLFTSTVPTPISILGYFLKLVSEPLDDLTDMCGALHVMSMGIGFRKFTQAMDTVKASINYSVSIKEEYSIYWERFMMECSRQPYTSIAEREVAATVMVQPQPQVQAQQSPPQVLNEGDYEMTTDGDPRTNPTHEFYKFYQDYPDMPVYDNIDDILDWIMNSSSGKEDTAEEEDAGNALYPEDDPDASSVTATKDLLAAYLA